MNNIIQQIADNSTTFFNKTMEDILMGKTALSGITAAWHGAVSRGTAGSR